MQSIRKWFRRSDALYVVLAVLLVLLYVMTAGGGFPLDDSWIHQVYARNLAETGRWEFVRGVPSAGSTSPLYTLLLAAGYALGINYVVWTHLLGVIALSAAGIIGARLAEDMGEHLKLKTKYLPETTGAAVVGAWHLIWAAVSGMETMLMCTFTLALMWAALRAAQVTENSDSPSLRRGVAFGALAALATATRPEAVLLGGIIGIVVLATCLPAWRSFLVWSIGAALGFAVFSAPYFALNYQLTGGLLPNTAAAKQAAMQPALILYSFPERLWQMLYPLIAGGQLLLAPGMGVVLGLAVLNIRRERVWVFYLVPFVWAVALIALYAARLPAGVQHGRYVMPVLPGLLVIGVLGTFWLLKQGRATVVGRVLTRVLALTAGLLLVYFALLAGPAAYRNDVRIIEEEQVASALWIRDNLPPDQLLAVHDIGAVGYFAPRALVDVAGLVTPEVVPIILDVEAMWALLRQYNARYLMAFPDQIPGDNPGDPRLCPVYRSNGTASPAAGGPTMVVYAITWDGVCP
jgi:hypothetical protein